MSASIREKKEYENQHTISTHQFFDEQNCIFFFKRKKRAMVNFLFFLSLFPGHSLFSLSHVHHFRFLLAHINIARLVPYNKKRKEKGSIILSNRKRLHHIYIEDDDDGNLLFFYILKIV